MPTTTLNSSILLHNVAEDTPSKVLRAWEPLEQLARKLQESEQTEKQVRLLLQLVCQATHAQCAFWYQKSPSGQVQVIPDENLPREWCESVAAELLANVSGSRLEDACPAIERLPPPGEGQPRPASVAVIRMSRSASAWLVAVGFHPDQPLSENDVRVIRLAKRMYLNHQRAFVLSESLRSALVGLMREFAAAIDAKDQYTRGHSERVARIGARLATEMQLTEDAVTDIYLAGLLHDIGKIAVRDHVLGKPGKLTTGEYEQIQEHPVIGHRVLETIAQLRDFTGAVRSHHERYDGRGYPDGLRGDETPLIARILAVADAFDAMLSPRPYRPALSLAQIDQVMVEGAGSQWDADILDQFMLCRNEAHEICARDREHGQDRQLEDCQM